MTAPFSLTNASDLFKINYYKKSENMYNSANVLHGRIKKRYDFTGSQRFIATPLSYAGGVGSGSLPAANTAAYDGAVLLSKKVYAVCEVDRESIKAAEDDKGAFVRSTKEVVQKCVESYMRNCSRILFGNGQGILGRGDATGANVSGAGSVGDPYLVELPAATFNEANFEEKDFVNIITGLNAAPDDAGGTSEGNSVEVVEVNPSTRVVSLVGTSAALAAASGAAPLSATEGIAMQGSYTNDPHGLKNILDATSGSLYSIPVSRRWQATQVAAGGAGITPDRMNNVMLEIERKFGRVPNLIVTSYTQMRKILDFLEDHKRYPLPARNGDVKGKISFEGVEFMSSRGAIGIFADRFCDADRMYFLNDNFIECHHRPGFGWFDDDGTVFLRKSGSDEYEARYGGYYQNLITPSAHGVLTGLAT